MIIYKTTNLVNGKFYIGKDKYNNKDYIGSGKILKSAIEKYGIENFKKDIIEVCNSYKELNEREIFWINFTNAIKNGYNIAIGGDGGDTISNHPNRDEICKKHSDWMFENNPTKGIKRSDDSISKWKESYGNKSEGINNPNYGKNHSDETKSKISKKALGRVVTEETRKKISLSNKGKKSYWKDKKNKKHSDWMTLNNPMKGKFHTEETKKIISEINKKPKSEETKNNIRESLIEYYEKGNKPKNTKKISIDNVIYDGYNDASISLNIPVSTIRNRIKSKNYKEYYHVTS